MKEQLFLVNSRVTETEELSIKGVIKLYFSYNLITSLHGHPVFGFT